MILHPTLEGIEKARGIVEQWLGDMGLNLKASKTRVVHTRHTLNDQGAGFDFLGFTVRQYDAGKTRCGRNNQKEPTGFVARITPSKEAISRHR